MEQVQEKSKRQKQVVALRNPRDYTGKAVYLLILGAFLPGIGFALCVYHLWDALYLQYHTGKMQKGLIWLILVTFISGFMQVLMLLFLGSIPMARLFRSVIH